MNRNLVLTTTIILVLTIAGIIGYRIVSPHGENVAAAKNQTVGTSGGFFWLLREHIPTATPLPTPIQTEAQLAYVVAQAMDHATGTYGLAIKNLQTGESFYANEHVPFDAASLYKLWIMAAVYSEIDAGRMNESMVLSADIPTLNATFNISSNNAERTDGGVSLTVADALNRMITVSDNYAALLLGYHVTFEEVKRYLHDHGLYESILGSRNTITALDASLFYEKLYNGELASSLSTAKMFDLLIKQELNDQIPRYLPADVVVAHKTGALAGVNHDAGMILGAPGNYIIVILSNSATPVRAKETNARLSEAVFNYFTDATR